MISAAIVGALSGGLLRLAPELIKYLDRRDDRRHELDMQRVEARLTVKMWGKARSAAGQPLLPGTVDALRALELDRQIGRAGKRFPFVDAVAALVRPSVTWALLALYAGVRITALTAGQSSYGVADLELFSTVLSYWFVNRTMEKK